MTITEWMRAVFTFLVIAAAVCAAGSAPAVAAQNGAVYVTRYVEVLPQSIDAATALLKTEATATHGDEGCVNVRALRETGQDNRFMLLELWRDQSALDSHNKAQHAQQFRDQLESLEVAPPDERVFAAFWFNPASNPISADAVWVIAHVDVMPPYADQGSAMLKAFGEASSKEPGNLRFVAMQQVGRTNHFTVGEVWSDRTSFDAHLAAAQTKEFRRKLNPMLGALYDQRLYRELD